MAWQVAALRIGANGFPRSKAYYGYRSYGEPDARFQMTFYLWVVRRGEDVVVVDTGYDEAWFERRGAGVPWAIAPQDALAAAGVDPRAVPTVILTHLHFDHIGGVRLFPNAEYVLQRAEWNFWHGELGRRPPMRAHTDTGCLDYLGDAMADGRVRLCDGRAAVRDGVEVLPLPGHTPGQQGVLVDGGLVLAGDAVHLYEELDARRLFATFTDAEAMYDSYGVLRALAARGAEVVPGHDPAVMERFPPLLATRPTVGVNLRAQGVSLP